MEKTIRDEAAETTLSLLSVRPARQECEPRDRRDGFADHRQQRPAALAVGAVPGLSGA
jgi:hypothetical protein